MAQAKRSAPTSSEHCSVCTPTGWAPEVLKARCRLQAVAQMAPSDGLLAAVVTLSQKFHCIRWHARPT